MKSVIILVATFVIWSAPAFCRQQDDAAGLPVAVFSPRPINFGFLTQTHTKKITLTVTNTGSADLVVTADHLSGDEAIFSPGADTCAGETVPPGGTCQVELYFTPTEIWAKPMYAYFAIFDNASNGYQYVLMYGWDNPNLK
jgi:hypothetical protein